MSEKSSHILKKDDLTEKKISGLYTVHEIIIRKLGK